MISASTLRDTFPGVFDDRAYDKAIARAITRAKARASAAAFGDRYDLALTYLAAHFASLLIAADAAVTAGGSSAAASTGLTSVSAGPVSMSFGSGGAGAGGGDGSGDGPPTTYYAMFQDLSRSTIPRILTPLR